MISESPTVIGGSPEVPLVIGETPEPSTTERVTEPIQHAPQRRTTRSTAEKPPKRFYEESDSKFGVRKASAATQNERWEVDIFETGLCFASASLRVKTFNVPIPTSSLPSSAGSVLLFVGLELG